MADRKVYFIQSGQNGPIKIGVAKDVRKRLWQLQTSSHEPLTLLGTCDGDEALEAEFHLQFSQFHIRGEWFAPDPLLLEEGERRCSALKSSVTPTREPLYVAMLVVTELKKQFAEAWAVKAAKITNLPVREVRGFETGETSLTLGHLEPLASCGLLSRTVAEMCAAILKVAEVCEFSNQIEPLFIVLAHPPITALVKADPDGPATAAYLKAASAQFLADPHMVMKGPHGAGLREVIANLKAAGVLQ
ncbi:GIY-YIG nuclease family protein [uncultured Devosia sp.]|uniref:GIY-YIG nuclease family protein n=1 Tax=uncultured Devosia sp. TaxID=211434 RepID=UPI0026129440|nr:GIY-YIG nuclease family protein [uncultured Devosia sp.]